MAIDKEILALIKDVPKWNKWKAKQNFRHSCNFLGDGIHSYMDLRSTGYYTDAILRRAGIDRLDRSDPDLIREGTTGPDLRNVNLSRVRLDGIDFSGVDLRGANLSGAILYNANFTNAHLSEADL